MPSMPAVRPADARARRIGKNVALAIVFATVVPLVALAYLTYGVLIPGLDAGDTGKLVAIQIVAVVAALGIVAGGWALTVLSRTVSRASEILAVVEEEGVDASETPSSLARMQAALDRQAAEIATYQNRLEEAEKELEATSARLQETSFKDEVTGLYNRRFFTVRLEEELSRHRRFNHPVAIVLFDLDGFKAVNDELGHAVGDETLRDVAQVLMKHSRGINVVSRYGGDEFAILLVETSKAGARLYADRIRQVISSYPYSHGKRITASFGIASLPDDEALTSEDLFRVADDALYVAKRAGKNQVAAARSNDNS
jgi:diguanylate cyclase (GGDEF)-like protein